MTNEQRVVLAHAVVDPDVWFAHAVTALGQEAADEALVAKVERWRPNYEAAKSQPNYKTRAERDGEESQ